MKKKLILMGIAGACVVTAAIVGNTLASTTLTTGQESTDITTKELNIGIYCGDENLTPGAQNTENPEVESVTYNQSVTKRCMPGDIIEAGNEYGIRLPLTVKNDAADGYDTYIRVYVYKTWQNENAKSSELNEEADEKLSVTDSGVTLSGWGSDSNWILTDETNEGFTLYYKKPLAKGESTGTFLDKIAINENLGNAFKDKQIYFEIEAEAVQALPAKNNTVNADAIMSAWGMTASFNDDSNTIISIQ